MKYLLKEDVHILWEARCKTEEGAPSAHKISVTSAPTTWVWSEKRKEVSHWLKHISWLNKIYKSYRMDYSSSSFIETENRIAGLVYGGIY